MKIIAFAILLAGVTLSASAKQYNQPKRLDSDGQSTVNRVIADGYRQGAISQSPQLQGNDCSSNVNIGNVTVPQGGQAPREVTTVILGDVINVNRGCR